MRSNIYVVHDGIAEEYSAPFLAKNDALACRMYKHILQQNSSSPDEFRLVCLGSFDSETAGVDLLNLSRVIEVSRAS